MQDLTRLSALAMAQAVRKKEISPVELVEAHLRRIERLNPILNAFVDVRADAAIAEARAQDAAAASGVPRGALGGLPISIKSAIEVSGLRCETGSPSRKGVIATQDATCVARLRAAGAIVLGTTNVAEMLMGYESDNPLHGLTMRQLDGVLLLPRACGADDGRRSGYNKAMTHQPRQGAKAQPDGSHEA